MQEIDRHYLSENHVRVKSDSAFQSELRLFQSLWRQERGLTPGVHRDKPLGSLLEMPSAQESLANYLTPTIRQLVREEVEGSKGEDKAFAVPRIYDNLLSSQPLCFNLFGEMAVDLELATQVARRLWPDEVNQVTSIEFEWSPPADVDGSMGDGSAIDVVMFHTTPAGARGFVAFEVKYHENLRVGVSPRLERHDEIATASGAFVSREHSSLASPPLQQIWLPHLLTLALLESGEWSVGRLVFLHPSVNTRCISVAAEYERHLSNTAAFERMELETLFDAIGACTESPWVEEFGQRYLGRV